MGNLTPESFLIAISGIVIVFLVLSVLCLLIPVVSRCVQAFEKNTQAPVQTVQAPSASPAFQPSVYGGDVALVDVDEKTAACIMAIVSHETGIPLSELVFKKIKAL